MYVNLHCHMHFNNYTASCAGPTECQDGVTNNCTQTCNRTVSNGTSSYECGCYEGYELDSDNTTCVSKYMGYI